MVLSLGYDHVTSERKRECRPFKGTKTEARKALNEFRREVEYGLKINADKTTFEEYASQWQKSREASGRFAPATIKRNKEILTHLLRHLATIPLGDIDATTVRNLYLTLAYENVGQHSLAKAGIMLKQILRQAVNDDIILRNPCDRVEAPKQSKAKKTSVLDKAGVARLMEALNDAKSNTYPLAALSQPKHTSDMAHVTAVQLALAAGLRRGEILGLSWCDVNFDNAMLNVRHTLCKTTGELKEPKTESSHRDISLDAQMMAALAQWKLRQVEYLFSLGIKQDTETPVITNEAGERMDGNNLARWWRSFQRRYGFEGIRIHDLRHIHATMLVSSGLNIKAVSSRLGHASVGITLDLCAHAQREDDEKAAAIIGQIMAEPAPRRGQVVNL